MTVLRSTPLRSTVLLSTPLLLTSFAVSCGGDRSRSPTCGMAQLIGPSLIQDQLRMLPYVLSEAPRGLPGSLPARVAGTAQLSTVTITSAGGRLAMTYQGQNFPPFPTETVAGTSAEGSSTSTAPSTSGSRTSAPTGRSIRTGVLRRTETAFP